MDRFVIADDADVVVGVGLAAGNVLPDRGGRSAAVVVTQPGARRVAGTVAAALPDGLRSSVLVMPDGEAAKSLAEVERLYLAFDEFGLHHGDAVVAVGGGSLTDAAGYAAATYLRGVEAVYVPTTLLGAVDAAIGGKTGINLAGKNLIGAFRHPARVVVDVDVLASLPAALLREGAAEAFKAGMIADPSLVDLYEADGLGADVGSVVRKAVAVKTEVVAEDFRESGRRLTLNYGHTVGHGVEVAGGVSHGEAVAVGMVAAGAVSAVVTGFADADRQRSIIASLGLPTSAAGIDRGAVRSLVAKDKKRDATGLRMVLLEAVGRPVVVTVDDATLDLALDAVGL